MSGNSRGVRSAPAIVALAATAAVVAAAVLAIRAASEAIGPSPAAASTTVAELLEGPSPASSRRVSVRGRLVRGARHASLRFRLRGPSGAVIEVMPQLGVAVPRMRHGRRLRVTGRVVRLGGARLIAATRVRAGPSPLYRSFVASRATVREIRRHAGAFDRRSATVAGRVRKVVAGGFVLSQGRLSLFVATEGLISRGDAEDRPEVTAGRRVAATGQVQRLSRLAARKLAARAGKDVTATAGEPYLIARVLR